MNDKDAMYEIIRRRLITKRYSHLIYDQQMGSEIDMLLGKPAFYIRSQLTTMIPEILLSDPRIKEVKDMTFEERDASAIICYFTVVTDKYELKLNLDVNQNKLKVV
jgi:hypothetical protein